jgi:hypothetical protein
LNSNSNSIKSSSFNSPENSQNRDNFKSLLKLDDDNDFKTLKDFEANNKKSPKTFSVPQVASGIFRDQVLLNPIINPVSYKPDPVDPQTMIEFNLRKSP